MMERMFKVSYEIKSIRILIVNININEVSANNGQSQITLAYTDFFNDAKKEE